MATKKYRSRLVGIKMERGKDGLLHYGKVTPRSDWREVSAKEAGMAPPKKSR